MSKLTSESMQIDQQSPERFLSSSAMRWCRSLFSLSLLSETHSEYLLDSPCRDAAEKLDRFVRCVCWNATGVSVDVRVRTLMFVITRGWSSQLMKMFVLSQPMSMTLVVFFSFLFWIDWSVSPSLPFGEKVFDFFSSSDEWIFNWRAKFVFGKKSRRPRSASRWSSAEHVRLDLCSIKANCLCECRNKWTNVSSLWSSAGNFQSSSFSIVRVESFLSLFEHQIESFDLISPLLIFSPRSNLCLCSLITMSPTSIHETIAIPSIHFGIHCGNINLSLLSSFLDREDLLILAERRRRMRRSQCPTRHHPLFSFERWATKENHSKILGWKEHWSPLECWMKRFQLIGFDRVQEENRTLTRELTSQTDEASRTTNIQTKFGQVESSHLGSLFSSINIEIGELKRIRTTETIRKTRINGIRQSNQIHLFTRRNLREVNPSESISPWRLNAERSTSTRFQCQSLSMSSLDAFDDRWSMIGVTSVWRSSLFVSSRLKTSRWKWRRDLIWLELNWVREMIEKQIDRSFDQRKESSCSSLFLIGEDLVQRRSISLGQSSTNVHCSLWLSLLSSIEWNVFFFHFFSLLMSTETRDERRETRSNDLFVDSFGFSFLRFLSNLSCRCSFDLLRRRFVSNIVSIASKSNHFSLLFNVRQISFSTADRWTFLCRLTSPSSFDKLEMRRLEILSSERKGFSRTDWSNLDISSIDWSPLGSTISLNICFLSSDIRLNIVPIFDNRSNNVAVRMIYLLCSLSNWRSMKKTIFLFRRNWFRRLFICEWKDNLSVAFVVKVCWRIFFPSCWMFHIWRSKQRSRFNSVDINGNKSSSSLFLPIENLWIEDQFPFPLEGKSSRQIRSRFQHVSNVILDRTSMGESLSSGILEGEDLSLFVTVFV